MRPAAPEAAAHRTDGENLGPLILSGFAWKAISQVTIQVTRIATAVLLARLLAPHEYGLAGMVLVFVTFALVFSDLALGNTLVQRAVIREQDRSTVFWTSIIAGVVFTGIGIALAGPISAFFEEPVLKPMIIVLSFTFLLRAVGITQSALLVREMSFRALELREMAATICGGVIGVLLALEGFGAWAIIAQHLAVAACSTLLVWLYCPWRPRWMYSLETLRDYAGFSGNVLGMNILTQLRGTTDNMLIGRFLGAPALGAYALAYNAILVPFSRIATPIAQVLFPALSRIQDDRKRIAAYWLRSLRLLSAVALPALLGLIAVAPDFVEVVFGHDWAPAIPVIQLLAIVGLLQTLQFLNPQILMALDRTSTILRWAIASYAASVAAFVIGLQWGIVGVAAAFAISATLFEPLYAWLTARALGLSPRELLSSVSGVALASVLMLGGIVAARMLLTEAGVHTGLRLPLLIALGAVIYLPLCAWWVPEVLAELRRLKPGSRKPLPEGDAVPA